MTRFERQMEFKIGDMVKINDNPEKENEINQILRGYGLSSVFIGKKGTIKEIMSFSERFNCRTYRMIIGNSVWYVPHIVLQRI